MTTERLSDELWSLLSGLFRAHPWHGVSIGEESPELVNAYIEIVPTDTIKYEVDKATGHLRVDRPQRYSNICPTLYGLVPQTYCAEKTAALAAERTERTGIVGDGDPLDICVLTEKSFTTGDILLKAKPVGGLRLVDGEEADDKIIAVLDGDAAYGSWSSIDACPNSLLERLRHYFLTYKEGPESKQRNPVEITHIYGRYEALDVLRRSHEDYLNHYGELAARLACSRKSA